MKFKVFSLPIYLTLILLSTFALAETAAQTDECELLLDYSHPRLTPELVSKIDRVSESDAYTLQMLRRLKGDHEQVVILIGEQHFKKPEDKESGADLIKESSLRGFESAELLPKSLIERIFPFIIKSMITKLKRETGSVASTSIFDALDLDGIILNHLTTTVENATEEEMDNLREDFNTLSDEELKKRIAFKLYDNWESEITVTWFDMKDTIQRFLSSIPEERKTVTFNIEEGYQPGFYDRLKNFYTDVPLIILAPSALSLIIPFPEIVQRLALSLFVVVGTAHYIIRPFVGKKIQFKELRYLFLPKEGQLAARDFNSASNIEAQLEDHPDEELLIVVLGKDHVEGVSRELVNLGPYSRIQSLKPIH